MEKSCRKCAPKARAPPPPLFLILLNNPKPTANNRTKRAFKMNQKKIFLVFKELSFGEKI